MNCRLGEKRARNGRARTVSIAIHEYAYLTSAAERVVLKYKNYFAAQLTFLRFSFRTPFSFFFFSYQLKYSCLQSGISHSSGTDSALLLDYVLLILRQLQHQNYTRGLIDYCCQRGYKSFLHPRRVYFSTSG